MLTLFSVPRAFEGHAAVIQRNAVQSWMSLHPDAEIILCGDDPGVEAAASEFKLRHIPQIDRTEYGTPYLTSAFANVCQSATHPVLCYVNADIMLTGDLIAAIRRVPFHSFLLTGRRWNVDISAPWDFERPRWQQKLKRRARRHGERSDPWWLDYFVFRNRPDLVDLPPLVVGRPGWDNWFLWHAVQLGVPVIDATRGVMAVHQAHDYGHVPGARSDRLGSGPEGDMNAQVVGKNMCSVLDADYILWGSRLWRAGVWGAARRRLWKLRQR